MKNDAIKAMIAAQYDIKNLDDIEVELTLDNVGSLNAMGFNAKGDIYQYAVKFQDSEHRWREYLLNIDVQMRFLA